jgi:hypothetical protein
MQHAQYSFPPSSRLDLLPGVKTYSSQAVATTISSQQKDTGIRIPKLTLPPPTSAPLHNLPHSLFDGAAEYSTYYDRCQ